MCPTAPPPSIAAGLPDEPDAHNEATWLGEASLAFAQTAWLDAWRGTLHAHGFAKVPSTAPDDDGKLDVWRRNIRYIQAVRFAHACEARDAALHYPAPPLDLHALRRHRRVTQRGQSPCAPLGGVVLSGCVGREGGWAACAEETESMSESRGSKAKVFQ